MVLLHFSPLTFFLVTDGFFENYRLRCHSAVAGSSWFPARLYVIPNEAVVDRAVGQWSRTPGAGKSPTKKFSVIPPFLIVVV